MKRTNHLLRESGVSITSNSDSGKVTLSRQRKSPWCKRAKTAFSLVEVVMAIGMVSFALLGVIALIPEGLMAVQNAETMQATGNIINQLRGQMQQLSFSGTSVDSIQSLPNNTYYYSTEGVQTNQAGAYYKATFTVSSFTPPAGVGEDASFNANSAQNVVVSLTYPPSVWSKTNSFSLLVARATDE